MGVPIGIGALNGIGGLMNKTHLKGGTYSKRSAYWKEDAKSNNYGTYHVKCYSSSCYRHVQNLVVTIETSTFDCFLPEVLSTFNNNYDSTAHLSWYAGITNVYSVLHNISSNLGGCHRHKTFLTSMFLCWSQETDKCKFLFLKVNFFNSLRGRRSKGKGLRELGHQNTREGGGRRGTPARKPLFSPSRLLIKKNNENNATVND